MITLYCTATVEPFAPAGKDRLHVFVHVSTDFQGEDGEALARESYLRLLVQMRDARFLVLSVTQAGAGGAAGDYVLAPRLQPDGAPMVLAPFATDDVTLVPSMPDALADWVERSGAAWNAPPPAEDADPATVGAPGLLGSIKAWDAPLSGMTALSRLAEVDATLLQGDDYVVVPTWAEGPTFDPAQGAVLGETAEFLLGGDLGADLGAIKLVLRRERYRSDPTSLVRPDGFLEMLPESEDPVPLLRRIRDRAGSALLAAPAILGVDWGAAATPDPWGADHLPRLRWRAAYGAMTLLDPMVAAVTMGGTARQGPFATLLNDTLRELSDGAGQALDATAVLTASVRRLLVQVPEPYGRSERIALVARLAGLRPVGAGKPASEWPEPASGPGDVPSLLAALLRLEAGVRPDLGPVSPGWGDDPEARLDRELASIAGALETEGGLEAAVLDILDELREVPGKPQTLGIDALLVAELAGASPFSRSPREAIAAKLGTDFNGAEAVRQCFGPLVEHFLMAALRTEPPRRWTRGDLWTVVRDAEWFAARLAETPHVGSALATLAAELPRLSSLDGPDPLGADRAALEAWLAGRYAAACVELALPSGDVRQRPDAVPRALSIQIAVDHDQTDGDRFDDVFQGLALLIRRNDERWAYANLAIPTVPSSKFEPSTPVILHPLRPASVDGERQLAIDFHGFPLALTDLSAGRMERPDGARTPFYRFTAPQADQLKAYNGVPALYYGARYALAAFAVAASGALPEGVAGKLPWEPRSDPAEPASMRVVAHSRTTAIGRVGLVPERSAATRSVLDMAIEDTRPLFRDYPRVALSAGSASSTSLDLWRAGDGSGRARPGSTLTLSSLMVWGAPTTLRVQLWATPLARAADVPIAEWRLDAVHLSGLDDLEIVLERDSVSLGSTSPDTVAVKTYERAWVRLIMEPTKDGASISFSEPEAAASGERPGFALLAPRDGGRTWKAACARSVALKVEWPRMAFLDFDRWVSNPVLQMSASGSTTGLKQMLGALMGLFATASAGSSDAEALAQLPDMAVAGLLVELVPLDSLAADRPAPLSIVVPAPSFEKTERLEQVRRSGVGAAAILRAVEEIYRFALRVSGDGYAASLRWNERDRAVEAAVPAGLVARLSIRPLVSASHFADAASGAPVISENVLDWAVGRHGEHVIFQGPAFVVETMAALKPACGEELWEAVAAAHLKVRPSKSDRRYQIVACASGNASVDLASAWRRLGSVSTDTQRWRFQGRPISSWADPSSAKGAAGKPVPRSQPSVELAPDGPHVREFQHEAFAGRDRTDAQLSTVPLLPQPVETVVLETVWDRPGATLWRHWMVLRSRYVGALADPRQGEVRLARADVGDMEKEPWFVVAMRADPGRIDLTRPQLRALVPLAASVSHGPDAKSREGLAIMAFLAEHPFAYGGLADRIGAEVKTGFGHVLTGDPQRLTLADSRKEEGPDPRLSYTATEASQARSIALNVDGPIGLTFDEPTTSSPVFANAALILTPSYLAEEATVPPEHFVSVSLRRYLDPRWTVSEDSGPTGPLAVDGSWWVELTGDGALTCGGVKLATAAVKMGLWTLGVDKEALLPGAPDNSATWIETSRAERLQDDRVILLHQPLDGRRAAVSVLLQRGSAAPLMLTAYEVTRPASAAALEVSGTALVQSVAASAATRLNWTRTGIDADTIFLASASRKLTLGAAPEPERVDRLVLQPIAGGCAEIRRAAGSEPLWAVPRHAYQRAPTHVHRLLAALVVTPASASTLFSGIPRSFRLAPARSIAIDQPAGAQIHMAEVEIVAQPLASGLPGGLSPSGVARYTSAMFDLQAIGRTPADGDEPWAFQSLLFLFRPLGALRQLGGSELTFRLSMIAPTRMDERAQDGADIKLKFPAPAREFASIMLFLSGDLIAAAGIDVAGEIVGLTSARTGQAVGDAARSAVLVSDLASSAAPGELWADVSMLTLPTQKSIDFQRIDLPLDRLFPGGDEDIPMAQAVAPAALRSMIEAEGRILAVSAPLRPR